jgi:superfamily I DNA/RNA helicase
VLSEKIMDIQISRANYKQKFFQGHEPPALTSEQQEIILSDVQNKCVIAGAGSGKTTVIKHLVLYAVLFNNQNSDEICALSFNRGIANDLKLGLSKLSSEYLGRTINFNVSTLHAQALKLSERYFNYRQDGYALIGDDSGKSDVSDSQVTLKDFIWLHVRQELPQFTDEEILCHFSRGTFNEELVGLYKYRFLQQLSQLINYVQQYEEDPRDLASIAKTDEKALMLLAFVQKYIEQKRKERYFDFDDILINCRDTLIRQQKENPALFKQIRNRYQYLLIDEFQDINPLHSQIIDLLRPDTGRFVVVGDPRQSIYGFNGCNDEYMSAFCNKYGNSQEFTLSTCFRCPSRVVGLANKFMSERNYKKLDFTSNNKDSNKVVCVTFQTDDDERQFWAQFIVDKLFLVNHYLPNEILVLCRTNEQLRLLRGNLQTYIDQREDDLSKAGYDLLEVHVVKEDRTLHKDDLRENLLYLTSIHSAKGLEAKVVILIDANDRTIPCTTSDLTLDLLRRRLTYDRAKEEENLFYVAVTRAKHDLLFIGRHEYSKQWQCIRKKSPYLDRVSEFLDQFECNLPELGWFADKYSPPTAYSGVPRKNKLDRLIEKDTGGDTGAVSTRRKLLELLKKNQNKVK